MDHMNTYGIRYAAFPKYEDTPIFLVPDWELALIAQGVPIYRQVFSNFLKGR